MDTYLSVREMGRDKQDIGREVKAWVRHPECVSYMSGNVNLKLFMGMYVVCMNVHMCVGAGIGAHVCIWRPEVDIR